jgi:hypothetical protein
MGRFGEAVTRAWCQQLAAGLPCQRIPRDGRPYLVRYFAAGWSPDNKRAGPALFLHQFVASDPSGEVHSHPWGWSASVILVGGYREIRCTGTGTSEVRTYRPGDVNVLEATDRHRIELFDRECWTLFLAGSFEREWTFAPNC